MLQQFWNIPVFSIRDERGAIPKKPLTFPELCKKHFGFFLPDSVENVSIEGCLLYLSMKDAMAFGPYAQDLSILNSIYQSGEKFWNEFQSIKEGNLTLIMWHMRRAFTPCVNFAMSIRIALNSHAEIFSLNGRIAYFSLNN